MRAVAPGRGPRGAAAAGALLVRADGAGRHLRPAALLHPHALRPVLLAALRLAAARPPRLGAAGAALPPRPARARRLWRGGGGRPAQPRPAGLLRPALHAQVRARRAALPAGTGGAGAGADGGRSLPCCGQEKGAVCTEIPGCCLPTEGVEVLLVSVCYLVRQSLPCPVLRCIRLCPVLLR